MSRVAPTPSDDRKSESENIIESHQLEMTPCSRCGGKLMYRLRGVKITYHINLNDTHGNALGTKINVRVTALYNRRKICFYNCYLADLQDIKIKSRSRSIKPPLTSPKFLPLRLLIFHISNLTTNM